MVEKKEIDRNYLLSGKTRVRLVDKPGDLFETLHAVLKKTLVIYGKESWSYEISEAEELSEMIPSGITCYRITATSESGHVLAHEFAAAESKKRIREICAELIEKYDKDADIEIKEEATK